MSDESGRLVFREGLLVQAVRAGHWIVLDELNLAPTEVLEALNRWGRGRWEVAGWGLGENGRALLVPMCARLCLALPSGASSPPSHLFFPPSQTLSPRLLDDNRELYVPELQEVVRPHPHFMLFATQNPPGIYAGRKTLSRCGAGCSSSAVAASCRAVAMQLLLPKLGCGRRLRLPGSQPP